MLSIKMGFVLPVPDRVKRIALFSVASGIPLTT